MSGAIKNLNLKLQNRLITSAAALALWEVCSAIAGASYFPHSWTTIIALGNLLIAPAFWWSFIQTIWLSLLSFLVGTVIATAIAVAVTLNRAGEQSTRGVINFFRSMPSVVMLPLLIASLGSSARTAVILGTIVVTFKLVTFVIRGIQQTDPRLIDLAKVMNLPFQDRLGLMYLPSAVAIAGTGLRLSASRAFGTIIAAGLVAGTPGLGLGLLMAESSANYPKMFAYVLVMGFTGSYIYSIFTVLERKLVHWRVAI